MKDTHEEEEQPLDLEHAARHLLEEARMVVPGIQALFGFQMIAVFTPTFSRLTYRDQLMHLGAIVLVVIAIALVMSPAAIHRHAESRRVTGRFVDLGSRLLLMAMLILAISICVDVYIVAMLIWNRNAGAITALLLLAAFVALWILMPILYRRRGNR